MLIAIAKKEVLENLTNFRVILFSMLCITLIPFSLYVNALSYQTQLDNYSEQQRVIQQERSANPDYDLQNLVAYRSPTLLYLFANGIADQFPSSFTITSEGIEASVSPATKGILLTLLGGIDYVFVLQMVLSLVTMYFAADVVVGEKESGTLRLILVNSVSRGSLLTGKLLGVCINVGFPFTVAFLVSVLVAQSLHPALIELANIFRILSIYLVSLVLLFAYLVIGVAVSCLWDRSRPALTSVLLLWALFQLIVPKAGPLIARVVVPVASEVVQSAEKEALRNSVYAEEGKETARAYVSFWGHYPRLEDMQDKVRQDEWRQVQRPIHVKYEQRLNASVKAKEEYYQQRRNSQESVAESIADLSPGVSAADLITDIAGTGRLFAVKFNKDVEYFRDAVERQVFSVRDIQRIVTVDNQTSLFMRANREQIKDVPRFAFHQISIGEIVWFNSSGLIILTMYVIAGLIIGYSRFSRYDVR